MAYGRHIENHVLAISWRHTGRLMRNLDHRWRITCRYRSRDQNGNFCKFKMQTYLHISAVNYPITNKFGMQMQISISRIIIWQKIEIFQIQDSGRMPYWKSFFGYISAPCWPINAKFGTKMKNHMQILIIWWKRNFRNLKIATLKIVFPHLVLGIYVFLVMN